MIQTMTSTCLVICISKSTLFMETICDYFKDDFKILLNDKNIPLGNPIEIKNFIVIQTKKGNKFLIAIDNVHNINMCSIFFIIKLFESFYDKDKVKFYCLLEFLSFLGYCKIRDFN